MENTSRVARFVRERIQATGKLQKDIARQAGFEMPNVITMIKQGKTKLPLAKIGAMAAAMEADPLHLLQLCLEEYQPDTWKAIAPFLETAVTADELRLLQRLRDLTGGPYLAALTPESKKQLEGFLQTLSTPALTH